MRAANGAPKDNMQTINTRRAVNFPACRVDEARANRAPSPILSRTDYRRMVAEILG
ncbi:MAG: hypothetical protein ABW173_04320 [Sphingomonas sp.]